MKLVLPTAPTVAASAAASLALLGSALDADTRPAATLLDSVQSGFVHEWLGPAVALAAIAAVDRFALAPRARGAAVPPAPPGEPSAARALERDAESLALCAPACALANLPLLAVAPPAHAHALCWALDWLAVAPAALLLRNGQLQRQYSFDDPADWLASAAQWSTSGTPIFAQPSSVDAATEVRVHEHRGGWRTLRFCGADGRSSVQSVTQMVGAGTAEPRWVANEYVKSLASVGLASGALGAAPRVAFLGLGAGTLPLLLRRHVPDATLEAVELDAAVVDAATSCLGLEKADVAVSVGDALAWAAAAPDAQYDAIFVDVFDGDNLTPSAFVAPPFVADVRRALAPGGVAVHNLHTGSPALDVRFAQAAAAYADAFGGDACRAVPVEHQGNTLLAAGAPLRGTGADALRAAAERETDARGLLFDAGARVRRAEEIK